MARRLVMPCLIHLAAAVPVLGGQPPQLRPAALEPARRGVEIDGSGAALHKSVLPSTSPASSGVVALGDLGMPRASAGAFAVPSAAAAAASSGLLATLKAQGAAEQREPLGTMLVLVNSEDEAEMRHLEDILVPSILRYLRFKTRVTVLYAGPFDPVEDASIKLHLNPLVNISFADVTRRVDQFAQGHAKKHAPKKKSHSKRWEMNEFWALHAHLLPELQHLRYAWRLSPTSSLADVVAEDLYEVMRKRKAALGYRLLSSGHMEGCAGLQGEAKKFYEENSQWSPQSLSAKAFLEMYETAECPLWSHDFEIVDLDYLRGNAAYASYASYIADLGGFAKHGWNAQSVRALFLGTQEEPERMLCMTPWVPAFKGNSELSCDAGLGLNKLFQNLMKDHFDHAGEVLQVKEVLPNYTAWSQPIMSNGTNRISRQHARGARRWAHLVLSRAFVFGAPGVLLVLAGGFALKKGRGPPRSPTIK